MKKSIILLGLILNMTILPAVKSSAQEQKAKDIYIETTAFHLYASNHTRTEYRYNSINQLVLSFSSVGDSIINIYTFEYDKNGNMIKNISLSLTKDKKNPDRYYCRGCLFTEKRLNEIKDNAIEKLVTK